jgi:regulator of sigma E protease
VPIKFDVVRDDARVALDITPRGGKIGVANHLIPRKFPIGTAFTEAVKESAAQTKLMVQLVQRLLTARVSAKSTLSGPIGIARDAGEAARRGLVDYLHLMALLSVSVGVLNLFPMAPLDGGHIAVLAAEMAIRRDLSERIKLVFLNAGFVLIMALMLFILYSDLSKTWVGKFLP